MSDRLDQTGAQARGLLRRVPARKSILLTGVAALALTGVVGTTAGLTVNAPAFAQERVRASVPSFADVVQAVKPAVVAIRVSGDPDQPATTRFDPDEDDGPRGGDPRRGDPRGPGWRGGPDFRGPDFPPGSPQERFFRRFGDPRDFQRPDRRGPRGVRAQGSGFFISADGYVVTNNHVLANSKTAEVILDDGRTLQAKVVGADPKTDLALLKVEGTDFPFVRFAETPPRVGDWVVAIGNPFGLGGSVTAGIISARARDIGAGPYDDFLQIDAPINKGNSGGPAFNLDGEVIGVNTAIFSPNGGSIGIGFAIPAETVRSVVAQLRDTGTVTRGWIGVRIQTVNPDMADALGLKEPRGAIVDQAEPNAPAAKAGIRSGDVIVAVDGKPVKDARELARLIGGLAPDRTVQIGIVREGKEQTVELALGRLPTDQPARADRGGPTAPDDATPRLGLTLEPASRVGGGGEEGLVVTRVDPNSPAAEKGIREGDIILEVGGRKVQDVREVREAIAAMVKEGRRTILLRVKSGDQLRFTAVPLGRG